LARSCAFEVSWPMECLSWATVDDGISRGNVQEY
jgi:hypothetical protein